MKIHNFGYMLILSAASLYAASTDEQSTAVTVNTEKSAAVLNSIIHTNLGKSLPEVVDSSAEKRVPIVISADEPCILL